jgi:hypothetical protein
VNADTHRDVPPVSWEHASLQQIRDMLNLDESVEDIYRVVDELGTWATELEEQLARHEQHWATMSSGLAGVALERAAAHSAQTRADLTAALDDVRTVQSSLDRLAATFVHMRDVVERLYQDHRPREQMLDWVLVRDDEPTEQARRDATQWARKLMSEYEKFTNDELRTWPPTGHPPAGDPVGTGPNADLDTDLDTTTTVSFRDAPTFPGDDGPTKPIRATDGQSPPSPSNMAGGAAFPGAFHLDEDAVRHNPFPSEEQLFGSNGAAFPPVIGADDNYEKGEDDSW